MAETKQRKHSEKPHGFWSFEWHGFCHGWKMAEEGLGKVLTWSAIVSPIILFPILQNYKGDEESKMEARMNHWFAFVPFVIWAIWLLINIIRAPQKLYRTQHDEFKGIIKTKDEKLEILEKQVAEKSEADKLVIQKQRAKEALGIQLLALDAHLHNAKQKSRVTFYGDEKDKAWEDTGAQFNAIEKSITEHLGLGEVSLFRTARPEPIRHEPNNSGDPSILDWRWHVEAIECKMEALKGIIGKIL
jgi:hypothetical protein